MNATLPPGNGSSADPGDHDLLAAEYVLGLLQLEARRLAQARLQQEPGFAAEVARWGMCFAPWLDAIPPVAVPPELWARIRATLWQHELPERDTATPATAGTSLWQNLAFWRGLSAAGAAIAMASLALLLLTLRRPPARPAPPAVVLAPAPAATPMVVTLRHDDGSVAYTATLDPASGSLTLIPVRLGGDPSLSPELWLIPAGGAPRSLGMVARDKPMVVTLPLALRKAAGADGLFAISLEPAGSSAHLAPTGPVVAKGSGLRL